MDMVRTNNFIEVSACEMQRIEGGSFTFALGTGIVVFVAGLMYVKHKYF